MKVRAVLRLLTTEQGGRATGVGTGYRPNHNFGPPEGRDFFAGVISFVGSRCEPGDTKEVFVDFLPSEDLKVLVVPGRHWRIQEAARLVGEAKVLEVLSEL